VIYLLDVNALLALGHAAHVHHSRVGAWLVSLVDGDGLATCSITELGFVRIAPQARLSPSVAAAKELLVRLTSSDRPTFTRLADDLRADALPDWVMSPAQTTDGHLSELARRRSARLATLDEGIPGAFLIPGLSAAEGAPL
jgi:toxin-antitoxin system PIN domain toxin